MKAFALRRAGLASYGVPAYALDDNEPDRLDT